MLESEGFLAQVAELVGSVERWDEIKWSGDWLLERDPTAGEYIADDDAWALQFVTNPPIVVFYNIDEAQRLVTPRAAYRVGIYLLWSVNPVKLIDDQRKIR